MYFFLGLVAQEDLLNGNIQPSYILCKSHGGAESRSGYRVYRCDEGRRGPIVLVTEPKGNDDLVDFLSSYRTRDHIHTMGRKHEKSKKYYPKGALFWFECNRAGEQTGPAIFIQRVPVRIKHEKGDQGFERLKERASVKLTRAQLLSREPDMMDLVPSDHTLYLSQNWSK